LETLHFTYLAHYHGYVDRSIGELPLAAQSYRQASIWQNSLRAKRTSLPRLWI